MRQITTNKDLKNELFDGFLYFVDGDEFISAFQYNGRKYRVETTEDDLVIFEAFSPYQVSLLLDPDTGRPVVTSTKYSHMDTDKVLDNLSKIVTLINNR